MATELYYSLEFLKTADPMVAFSSPADLKELNKEYRKLMLFFHPDRNSGTKEDEALATEISSPLGTMLAEAKEILENGGKRLEIEIIIGKKKITFSDLIHNGALSFVLRNKQHALKVLKEPDDEDLFRTAEKHLKFLKQHKHFRKYLPQSPRFIPVALRGRQHLGMLYSYTRGFTLREVKAKHGAIPAPHATWMLNRVLEILSWSHSNNIANMAVLPRHVIIIPKTHGGILLDWSCSTSGKPVLLAETDDFGKYPAFVNKKPNDVRYADVLMAFDIYKWLAGEGNLPVPIQRFINRIYNDEFKNKETSYLYRRFQTTVDSVWERKFLPFRM